MKTALKVFFVKKKKSLVLQLKKPNNEIICKLSPSTGTHINKLTLSG